MKNAVNLAQKRERYAIIRSAKTVNQNGGDRRVIIGVFMVYFYRYLSCYRGCTYALWQLNEAQKVMQTQSQRIGQLEDRLAVSDDSATQSLSSLSVKIKDLHGKSVSSESEIAKLWDTRKVNLASIASSDKKIVALEKKQKSLLALKKTVGGLDKKITGLSSLKASLASTSQSVAEHDLLLQSVRERVANTHETVQTLLPKVNANTKEVSKTKGLEQRLDKRIKGHRRSYYVFRCI